ncbi:MAG: deoxyribodipyrimidine photolyase-related protein, partial [Oceanospirillaceae bacterium]
MTNFHTLRLILGDQLNRQHSWYQQRDDGVLYLIAELHQEAEYVTHHIQKLCAFFAAMEDFADSLRSDQHQVSYLNLDDTAEYASLPLLLKALCQQHSVQHLEYQQPDEYRLAQQLQTMDIGATVSCCDTEHFLLPQSEI